MIVILIDDLEVRGGTNKAILRLIEYASSQKIEMKILVRNLDYEKTYPEFKNFKDIITVLNFKFSNNIFHDAFKLLKTAFQIRTFIKDAKVINFHEGFYSLFLPFFIGKKVVWQIHDLPSFFRVGVFYRKKNNLKEVILKYYVLTFKFVISEFSVCVTKNAELVRKVFNRKAHVFYAGIDPINIEKNYQNTLLRFKNKKVNLLSSGVFFPYRNYETQVAVVEELSKRGIDVRLNIIGSLKLNPQYAKKIELLIQDKNLSNNIIVCGQVDESYYTKLHQESDIFLFINIEQSWGLGIFEAMSAGLPVIVSNSVGATEILSDKLNSIFVNPVDINLITNEIISLMENEENYNFLVENSRIFHESYTWDKSYSSKMIELFSS